MIEFGRRASTSTASECPSRAAMNGLANMRSIFAAFNARMRSRARENGCCKGSRFLRVGVGSPGLAGRWAEGACCRTEIFCRWNQASGEETATVKWTLPPSRLGEKSKIASISQLGIPSDYAINTTANQIRDSRTSSCWCLNTQRTSNMCMHRNRSKKDSNEKHILKHEAKKKAT